MANKPLTQTKLKDLARIRVIDVRTAVAIAPPVLKDFLNASVI